MSACNDIVTSDMSRFGMREREMAARLLAAYCENPPEFLGSGVRIMMNMLSGYVFLSDEDFAVAMMNGDTLEEFHSCPECGAEGFAEELGEHSCCRDYLKSISSSD